MDFLGFNGFSRIRWTLPSVVSAVWIAQNWYLADSLLIVDQQKFQINFFVKKCIASDRECK